MRSYSHLLTTQKKNSENISLQCHGMLFHIDMTPVRSLVECLKLKVSKILMLHADVQYIGIPTLVILEGSTGNVITESGRGMVNIDPNGEVV